MHAYLIVRVLLMSQITTVLRMRSQAPHVHKHSHAYPPAGLQIQH